MQEFSITNADIPDIELIRDNHVSIQDRMQVCNMIMNRFYAAKAPPNAFYLLNVWDDVCREPSDNNFRSFAASLKFFVPYPKFDITEETAAEFVRQIMSIARVSNSSWVSHVASVYAMHGIYRNDLPEEIKKEYFDLLCAAANKIRLEY